MIEWGPAFEHLAMRLAWFVLAFAGVMVCVVTAGRMALAIHEARQRRFRTWYGPLVDRALEGDDSATRTLIESPMRNRILIGRLLGARITDDRDPVRIAAARTIARAMSLAEIANRYLGSRWWWRRTLAVRALGLAQFRDHTPAIVAALDDRNAEVRNAALDALADMQDPASLPAIVVRLHDPSLQAGRRLAALVAFGSKAERFLIELAEVDQPNRVSYAEALGICGTACSRGTLCEWTRDGRADVQAAAFAALAHVGLDDRAATLAVDA